MLSFMTRTTVTLDPDTEQIIRVRMRRLGVSFKRALNDAIRDGDTASQPREKATRARSMGAPKIDLTRALDLAAELADEQQIAKLDRGR